ncbi:MAG: DUF402 domain-containing protein [Zhenhengia sp.]|uniref:DUF402 domain-containing protein n=1 Tax=Zhenhengia sp. TaxID=2944208 RepID=UPI003992A5C0
MKRKYLDGSNWAWLAERSYKWIYVDGEWKGYASLVKMGSVKRKLKAHYNAEVCLCDDGYKGIIFLPDNETWCVTAIYNRHNEIVEWYFDMTKENGVDERNIPYFEDLYLDVIVAPDFSVHLIDEDELQEALDEGTITKEEYDLAYRTYEKLVEEVIRDEEFLTVFLPHYLEVLDH